MADSAKKKKKPVKMNLAEFVAVATKQEAPASAPVASKNPNTIFVWNVAKGVTFTELGDYFYEKHFQLDDVKEVGNGVFAVIFASEADARNAYSLNKSSFRSSRLYFGDSPDQPPAEYANRGLGDTAPQREQEPDDGYRRGGDRDYPRREGGFQRRDYPPREGGGFRERDGGGFRERDGGFRDGGFRERDGGGFRERDGGFRERDGGGFRERDGGGFRERDGGGFHDRGERRGPPPLRSDQSSDWRSEARAEAPAPRTYGDRSGRERSGFSDYPRRDRNPDGDRPREGFDDKPRERPRINVDALKASLAAPAAEEAPRSTANPFGAARPVDTASKLEKLVAEAAVTAPKPAEETKAAEPAPARTWRQAPREADTSSSKTGESRQWRQAPREHGADGGEQRQWRQAPREHGADGGEQRQWRQARATTEEKSASPSEAPREKTPRKQAAAPAEPRRQEPAVVNKFQGLSVDGDDE